MFFKWLLQSPVLFSYYSYYLTECLMQFILLFGTVNFWLLTPDVMKISIFMGRRITFPVHFICNNSSYFQVLACLSLCCSPMFCLHWKKMCAINCVRRGQTVVPRADGNSFFLFVWFFFKWIVFLRNLAFNFWCLEIKLIVCLIQNVPVPCLTVTFLWV